MKRITLAIAPLLLVFFTMAAWAQTKSPAERITQGPDVKKTTETVAEISWSTDEPGSSIVKYGTSPNALNETAEEPWGGTKDAQGYNHTVWIKNLKPNTTYYYRVETGQGKGTGTGTESQPKEFHTMAKK
ncbi:MAG TPA: fibronectin type III domain-containing protein [Candidatus Sulfotelmatobacter sp.]|nr:fibronectin type III domain-containing protein [Candidatus Sulfotelmatobacter sp.]